MMGNIPKQFLFPNTCLLFQNMFCLIVYLVYLLYDGYYFTSCSMCLIPEDSYSRAHCVFYS